MSVDNKNSLLVSKQLPEFVREDHPNFVAFMEAYYEFMETKLDGQNNDLTTQAKKLRYLADVDQSIGDFEAQFFNTYLSLVPQDAAIDKATMVKNIMPLYLAKGSEKSFDLLFRMIFGEPITINYPKDTVLRASDGKWVAENALRILSDSVYSVHTGNGTNKVFYLAQPAASSEVVVYVNGTKVTTGYYVQKEYSKITFTTAPANGAVINIFYTDFDNLLFVNRKITGVRTGTTALIERCTVRTQLDQRLFSLFINSKTLIGAFENGEEVQTDIFDQNGNLLVVKAKTFSVIESIEVGEGGASYNVGDPVIVAGGGATTPATAIVQSVFKGLIDRVLINYGGAGFQESYLVDVSEPANTVLSLAIANVDFSGTNTANALYIYTDNVASYNSVSINASDYGFPSLVVANQNSNTVIADALSTNFYKEIGPITTVQVLTSLAPLAFIPEVNARPAETLNGDITGPKIDTYGALARFIINAGGVGYAVGDEIAFNNKPMSFGIGAAAMVTSTTANGSIRKIEFQPERIEGTATLNSASNVTIIGTGTAFERDLRVGDKIMINSESRFVNVIHSNTSLNVNANFLYATTNKKIGVHGRRVLGGQGYTQDKLPTVQVLSTGAGANITVSCIQGDGERLLPKGNTQPGQIENIRIITGGVGYISEPRIDLAGYGDGTATANATLETPYITFSGKWTTTDSILSSADRRIQGGTFYNDYSYVISCQVEFAKYKDLVKNLLHPAGFEFFGEYAKLDVIDTGGVTGANVWVDGTVAGRINIANGSTIVYGSGTKFNVANSKYLLTVGSEIAVNNEIRVVDNIIDNTTITVSTAFTSNANDQYITVISVPYTGLGTEDGNELVAENELAIRID